jgi:hypothetical protein
MKTVDVNMLESSEDARGLRCSATRPFQYCELNLTAGEVIEMRG